MNVCALNKFIDMADDIRIDSYRFDPINEDATISKGGQSIVIDLSKSTEEQLSEFQSFLDGLSDGN